MIPISELKEKLDLFPDDSLVTVVDENDISVVAVYNAKTEPIGYICTTPGLILFDGKFALALDEIPNVKVGEKLDETT